MLTNLRIAAMIAIAVSVSNTSISYASDIPDLAKPRYIVPDKIAGVDTLTAEDLVNLALSDPDILIVDARIHSDRIHGYIEDSISLPDIETNCDSLSHINKDKKRHMLFYCNGMKCGRSVVSIKVARSCGYTSLSWFKGGFEEWKSKGYQYLTEK